MHDVMEHGYRVKLRAGSFEFALEKKTSGNKKPIEWNQTFR